MKKLIPFRKDHTMTNALLKIILLSLMPVIVYALNNAPPGIGSVANNVMEPVGLMSDFVNTGCFVIGGSFLFASLIKYFEHRRTPLLVPISTVIFLIIAGLLLILMPLLSLILDNGVTYAIFRR